jgi:NAD(P)H-flavin reductase
MASLLFEQQRIEANDDESVLDALTRHGHNIPYGCRAGVCQSCIMKAEGCAVPEAAQQGLNDAQKSLNYFLSCQCIADQEMSVKMLDQSAFKQDTKVISKMMLSDNIIRLRLESELDYQPGQFVTLWKDEEIGRSYSLASLPKKEEFLEFHIKVIENGQFSQWLKNDVEVGDIIKLQGPLGECIFSAKPQQPVLMAAIGTGLAPVYGKLRSALDNGHKAPIHLVLGARHASNFYLVDELIALMNDNENFQVRFICQDGEARFSQQDDIYQFCKQEYRDLSGWRVFLCGAESFVKKMRKQSFLAGAAMGEISADTFVAAT